MLGHYLRTLYRALARHRLYAALNVLGLALGIAVFLLLWLDVKFETGFERWIAHSDQIYVLRTTWLGDANGVAPSNETMGDLLPELQADYPRLVGTRIWIKNGAIRRADQASAETFSRVDPSFFEVFDLPLAAGDRATALRAPDSLVLTRSKAKALFDDLDPIGRSATLIFDGVAHVHRVTGVLADPPANTDLKLDFLIPLQVPGLDDPFWRNWNSTQVATYLRFHDPAQAAALDREFDRFTDRHGTALRPQPGHLMLRIRTLPLVSTHLIDPRTAATVGGLGAVGLLVLILSGVNYVNLATARAGLRAKEVAIRKVMGATELALMVQFMVEAGATAILAAVIGVGLCEAAAPLVRAAWGLPLRPDLLGPDGLVWAALVEAVGLGLLAGVYPALLLSRFQPAVVLASVRMPGGGRAGQWVREVLVMIQFGVATALIASAGVIYAQTFYVSHADLGFRRQGLIVVRSINDEALGAERRSQLIARWKALPGVVNAAVGDVAPGDGDGVNVNGVRRRGANEQGLQSLNYVRAGSGFLETYGARLIAGRGPDVLDGEKAGADATPATPSAATAPQSVILNATAVRALGFHTPQDAVGEILDQGGSDVAKSFSVMGVIADVRFHSPRQPVPPTIYLFGGGKMLQPVASVRYLGADPRPTLQRMARVWREVAPDVPFRARTAVDSLQDIYRPDQQHGHLFEAGAVLAVLIGCLGLYGLASFSTARRTKEIGIRKVLGASTGDVLVLLIGQFVRPVLLGNLIAWPLAGLAMQAWLAGYDQRIALTPAYFLAATALTLIIAVLTVAGQAHAVARARPAKALRYE
jgi:putative ABC transport system permease protein